MHLNYKHYPIVYQYNTVVYHGPVCIRTKCCISQLFFIYQVQSLKTCSAWRVLYHIFHFLRKIIFLKKFSRPSTWWSISTPMFIFVWCSPALHLQINNNWKFSSRYSYQRFLASYFWGALFSGRILILLFQNRAPILWHRRWLGSTHIVCGFLGWSRFWIGWSFWSLPGKGFLWSSYTTGLGTRASLVCWHPPVLLYFAQSLVSSKQ